MSWVSISVDDCTGCGLCAERCVRCFTDRGDEIVVQADEINCSLCGHCVALCPTGAITHGKMDMDNFPEISADSNFETDKFVEFIRKRRSHRSFIDKPIPGEVLEKLADVCRYAPTGSNVQDVELLIIQDRDKIRRLSDLTMESFQKARQILEQRITAMKAEGRDIPGDMQYSYETLQARDQMQEVREAEADTVFHNAPAVLIFHSPAATSAPKDNAVIASTTATLTAMTMGLESTYIGIFEAASTYRPIVEALGLPAGHKVFSVLIMGYPRLKYLRAVDRKPMKVRWE
ncbi:MAG: nitroreductase family protein [Deltaproteobacteria bacterium]|nr:nitroreductase family protein [Deltaproteobacteria bacterium]